MRYTLNEIEGHIRHSFDDDEIPERTLEKYASVCDDIDAWKCHLLRSVNQDLCRQELIENLPDDTIFVSMDWAMKWLLEKFREPQSDFFGKRGISWHITVVIRTNTNANELESGDEEDHSPITESNTQTNRYLHIIFVHFFDECAQDSEAVVAILHDVPIRMKKFDTSNQQCLYTIGQCQMLSFGSNDSVTSTAFQRNESKHSSHGLLRSSERQRSMRQICSCH